MSQVFHKLITKEKKLPTSYLEGIELICREDKYAFVALDNMAALLQQNVDCKLEPLDIITPATIAMALQRNSPFRGIINTQWVSSFISINQVWDNAFLNNQICLQFYFVNYALLILQYLAAER